MALSDPRIALIVNPAAGAHTAGGKVDAVVAALADAATVSVLSGARLNSVPVPLLPPKTVPP